MLYTGLLTPNDAALCDRVVADHREAIELGITGVPAVRPADRAAHVVGAHPSYNFV